MPDEKTHNDYLWWYLTGAAADGGVQADPDASLGKFRSSSEVEQLDVTITNPFANITIDFINGANGTGDGSLTASGVDELKWTPPGGSQGAGVTILNGETKIIEGGGGEPEKYVRVTRTDANNLTGTATLTLAELFNNVLGANNLTSAWAAAGRDSIRAAMVKNESASEVKSLKVWAAQIGTARVSDAGQLGAAGAGTIQTTGSFADWEDTGFCYIYTNLGVLREVVYYESRTDTVLTVPAAGRGALGTGAAAGAATDDIKCGPGIRLGKEAPSAQPNGFIEDETGDETVMPAGVGAWEVGLSSSEGIDIGDLAAGYIYGVWIRRTIPAGALSDPNVLNYINWSFEAA